MSSWQKEKTDESKKKEDEWGWGAILGGIAVAGAIAVGAGLAYKAYTDEQEKEQRIQHYKKVTSYKNYSLDTSSEDDSPKPTRRAIAWFEEPSTDDEKPMNKVQILERIHKDFVSIKGQKEEYFNYFMQVRKCLIPKMRKESKAFEMLTNGEALTGKYFSYFIQS